MSGVRYCDVLAEILNIKINEQTKDEEAANNFVLFLESKEDSLCDTLHSPDFICYFLCYLRESTAVLKRNDCNLSASHTNVSVSEFSNNTSVQPTSYFASKSARDFATACDFSVGKSQLMSTPKFRDDIATPQSTQKCMSSAVSDVMEFSGMRRLTPKANDSHSFQNPPRSDNRRNQWNNSRNQRVKNKPFSLSDFLSPEAGSSHMYGSTKKKTPKNRSQKSKRSFLMNSSVSHSEINESFTSSDLRTGCHSLSRSKLSAADPKSPVNPLFSEASRSISFDLGDKGEFPGLGGTPLPSAKPSRRIKPTAVNVTQEVKHLSIDSNQSPAQINKKLNNDGSFSSSNPFITASPITPARKCDLQEERQLLMQKRQQEAYAGRREVPVSDVKTPMKSLEDISPVKKVISEPSLSHVSETTKIKRLTEMYSYYINSFLVPCVTSELQFIIELLILPSSIKLESCGKSLDITGSLCNSSESNIDDQESKIVIVSKLLSSLANAVYFATHTLQALTLSGILSILGRSTISMLSQNIRIQSFLPTLQTHLLTLVEMLDLKEKDFSSESKYNSQEKLHSLSGVPFEAETDDRSNFPSDRSFHAFRKHRDSFYSLVREYEEKRLQCNFNIQQILGSRIRSLVAQVKEYRTYKPFTRLFVSQMLQEVNHDQVSASCSHRGGAVESFDESRLDLLASLRHEDPEKFRRLQSRFITAATPAINGSNKDILTEQCYFYKEFVISADSYTLNIHLCNELRNRISDIESQQSQQILDDVLAESVNTSSVSASLSRAISSLRILGRFLGFITFEPYNLAPGASEGYSSNTLNCISASLDDSVKNKQQLLVVPWTTEYLKSADFSSVMTQEAAIVTETLFAIYRTHTHQVPSPINSGNIMVALAISALFEMPTFPEDYFYQLLKKMSDCKYGPKTISFYTHNKEIRKDDIDASFDDCCLPLVSSALIFDWHKTLKEIRSSLLVNNTGSSTNINKTQTPLRKIKPSMERKLEETATQKKEKQLQMLLEDHFFRGQPSSLKRTVSFVAERCASNCVKHIRSVAMLEVCSDAENEFLKRISKLSSTKEEIQSSDRMKLMREIVTEMKTVAVEKMNMEATTFCEKAVPQCMRDLTSCETAEGVLKIATTIAKKKALASVHAWLNTRLDELVSVSVKARLTKVSSNTLKVEDPSALIPDFGFENETITSLQKIDSLSSLLHIMKEYIAKLTFANAQGCSESTFNCKSIDTSVPDTLEERDVSYILRVSAMLLERETEKSKWNLNSCDTQVFDSMYRLIKSSAHLRNSLILTAKELWSRSEFAFHNVESCPHTVKDISIFSNIPSACT